MGQNVIRKAIESLKNRSLLRNFVSLPNRADANEASNWPIRMSSQNISQQSKNKKQSLKSFELESQNRPEGIKRS